MTDGEWNDIRPGAPRAKDLGCMCPKEQPDHEHHKAYRISRRCELHQAHRFTSTALLD